MCVQVYIHTYVGTLVHVCMCMRKSEDKLRYQSSGVALSWNMANETQGLFLFLCLAVQGWDYNPSQPSFSTWVWESDSLVGQVLYQCTISQPQLNFFLMIRISHWMSSRLTATLSIFFLWKSVHSRYGGRETYPSHPWHPFLGLGISKWAGRGCVLLRAEAPGHLVDISLWASWLR